MGCAALQFDQDLDAFKVLKENIIFGGLRAISLQEIYIIKEIEGWGNQFITLSNEVRCAQYYYIYFLWSIHILCHRFWAFLEPISPMLSNINNLLPPPPP